jgi:5'-methylthioadenosine nucleosidase
LGQVHSFSVTEQELASRPGADKFFNGEITMKKAPRVAIQFAMRMEAAPLLEAGRFQKIPVRSGEKFGFEFHEGVTRLGSRVLVAVAGLDERYQVDAIGTLRAGLLTQELLTQFESPGLLINAGTAGGFYACGGQVGDVYLGQTPVVFHDRRVALPGSYPAFGEGRRPILELPEVAQRLGLKSGIVSTGDSLDCTPEDMKHLLRLGASVKEMEAAAIATVCDAHRVPLVLLKAITDIVDEHPDLEGASTEEQFLKNYSLAVGNLTAKLELLIEALAQP